MKKNIYLLLFLAVIAGCLWGCGGSGGGGGLEGQVASEAEAGQIKATLNGFLAAVQSPKPQTALKYVSTRFQSAGAAGFLTITDLVGKQYEFTVPDGGVVLLSPSMAIVKAYKDRIEDFRVELIFTLVKENGTWLIDDIEMTSTAIGKEPSPFFIEAVKAGTLLIGSDRNAPATLATSTPVFDVMLCSDSANIATAVWSVTITDLNTLVTLTASDPAQFSIVHTGPRTVTIAVGTTPHALQNGSLYSLALASPGLTNASGTPLETPAVRYFQINAQQIVEAPAVQGISNGVFKTDQSFSIVTQTGKTYSYSLDNGVTWLAYSGPVTLSSDGLYVIVARENVAEQVAAPLSQAISVTIDKTAPMAPTISGITAGTFNIAKTFQITGAEEGGTLHYSLDNGASVAVYTAGVTLSAGGYQVLAWQVDAAGNIGARSDAIALTINTTSLAWASEYPLTTDQGPFTARLAFKANRAGTVAYVVLPSGAAAPSAVQVIAGIDATGATAVSSGSLAISANTEVLTTVAGLALGTTYDVWAVVTDASDSTVGPSKVTVTIPAAFTNIQSQADWSIRSRFTPVMFNERIWVIGGGDGGTSPIARNDAWSSSDGVSWREETAGSDYPISVGRESHGVAIFDSRLWVLGGLLDSYSYGYPSQEIWSSSDGKNWTLAGTAADSWGGPQDNVGRLNFGLTAYKPSGGTEQLYLLGGFGGAQSSLQNDVWSSSNGTLWTSLGNAPWVVRESFGCAVFQGKIFVMGGRGNAGCLSDVWSFDGAAWVQVTANAPWGARKEMKAVARGDELFVFGGRNDQGELFGDLWYTRNGTDWTSVAGAFSGSPRTEAGFVSDGFHLFIMGGDNTSTMFNDVWKF